MKNSFDRANINIQIFWATKKKSKQQYCIFCTNEVTANWILFIVPL